MALIQYASCSYKKRGFRFSVAGSRGRGVLQCEDLNPKVMAKHLKFTARIVTVQEGNAEGAPRTLTRILAMDGLTEDITVTI